MMEEAKKLVNSNAMKKIALIAVITATTFDIFGCMMSISLKSKIYFYDGDGNEVFGYAFRQIMNSYNIYTHVFAAASQLLFLVGVYLVTYYVLKRVRVISDMILFTGS